MRKKIFGLFVILVFSLSLISVSAALTGSLGNSRMILRLEPGESIERYILVKNINDVPITIDINVGGDLADSLEIDETSFTLEPNTDKKVYFTIRADKPGTTETNLNVRFTPESGNGVGLAASIIVITSKSDDYFDTIDYENDPEVDIGNIAETGEQDFSFNPSGVNIDEYQDKGFEFSPILLLLLSSILLLVVLIGLYLYSNKQRKRKVKGRSA